MADLNTMMDMAKLGAGLAIGFAGLGAGIGLGIATKGLMDAMARQPEIEGKLFSRFIVGAALAEAIGIYGLLIAFMLIFVK